MTAFVVILTALQLAVPVRCYETPTVWQQQLQAFGVRSDAAGYYAPEQNPGPSYIALGPFACLSVRQATTIGAFVLGHELAHRWQDETGRPFDEAEADRIGRRYVNYWRTRLRAYFRLSAELPVVRLER